MPFPSALRRAALASCPLVALALLPSAAQTPSPPVTPPDLTLLNKAAAPIRAAKFSGSESELQMTASGQGMSFSFHETLKVTLAKPGRFHSELTLLKPDGSPSTRYTVISDGAKVWTSQPGAKQYSVTTRAAFLKSNDDLETLGIFAGLVASAGKGGASLLDTADLQSKDIQVTQTSETVDGADKTVYQVKGLKQGFQLRFWINPMGAVLDQLEMSGQSGTIDFTITEKMHSQTTPASVPATAFRFTPQPGSRRVKQVTIGPFG